MNRKRQNLRQATLLAICCAFSWLLLVVVFADQETVNYTYDDAGRLVTVTYGNQQAIHYQYDEAGNRTRKIVVGQDNVKADSNTNSLYDLWELVHFTDLNSNPTNDLDGDGLDNYYESKTWKDPNSASERLRVGSGDTGPSNQYVVVEWASETNAFYSINMATNLAVASPWSNLVNAMPATPPVNTYTDTVEDGIFIFYRIEAE